MLIFLTAVGVVLVVSFLCSIFESVLPRNAGDVLPGRDVASGLLTFDAVGASVGIVSFDFSVSDGESWSASSGASPVRYVQATSRSAKRRRCVRWCNRELLEGNSAAETAAKRIAARH